MAHIHRLIFGAFVALFCGFAMAGPCEDLAATADAWNIARNNDFTSCVAANPTNPNVCGGSPPTHATIQSQNAPQLQNRIHYVWVPAPTSGQPTEVVDTPWVNCSGGGGGECTQWHHKNASDECVSDCTYDQGKSVRDEVFRVSSITGMVGTEQVICNEVSGTFGALNCSIYGHISACYGYSASENYCHLSRGIATGAECVPQVVTVSGSNPTVTFTAKPLKDPPPKGMCPGNVNGVEVVVPCGTVTEVTTNTGLTNVTSSVTVTTSTNTTSTTQTGTTTQVTCAGGQCTVVTTVTTSANGSATSTVSTGTQAQGSLCKADPSLTVCKQSSFGGSCKTGYTCDGDAALCAVATAVNKSNCALEVTDPSQEKQAYEAAKEAGTTTGIQSSTVTFSSESFDQTDALSTSAGCVVDFPVTIMGTTVSIPVSRVCPYLVMLGNLLLAISFLSAAAIIGRP
ncbi:MAG: hypothetical protein AB7I35_14015 [Ramlibacter sp.]